MTVENHENDHDHSLTCLDAQAAPIEYTVTISPARQIRSISSLLSPPVAASSRDGDGEESAEQQLSGHGMFSGKQTRPHGHYAILVPIHLPQYAVFNQRTSPVYSPRPMISPQSLFAVTVFISPENDVRRIGRTLGSAS